MKIIITSLLLVIICLLNCSQAQAQEYDTDSNRVRPNQEYYWGVMAGSSVFGGESFDSVELSAAIAKFGYNLNKRVGFEIRVGTGTTKVEFRDFEKELDSLVGLYARLSYPLHRSINFYGLLGYTQVKVMNTEIAEEERTLSDSGGSIGGGFEFIVNPRARWSIEFTGYVDKDVDYGVASVGFEVSF